MDLLAGMEIFVRVVETGSFTQAARDLNLTQPTVTRSIALTEEHLKARLLNRTTRRVTVSEIGALYYERCKAILREVEAAREDVQLKRGEVEGVVRVGTSVAFGRRVVAPLLIAFMRRHPKVRIELVCEDRYVDLVAEGIDLALRVGRLADSTYGARHLGHNPWMMVASAAYLESRGEPQRPEELGTHDCLVYSSVQGDDQWRLEEPGGHQICVELNARMRSNNLSSLLAAVRSDLGLAILPNYVAMPSVAAGAVRRVMPGYVLPGQDIHAVFPSPKLVPLKVRRLIDFLKRQFDGEWWSEPRPASAGAMAAED